VHERLMINVQRMKLESGELEYVCVSSNLTSAKIRRPPTCLSLPVSALKPNIILKACLVSFESQTVCKRNPAELRSL
jgi:hypothetical protein